MRTTALILTLILSLTFSCSDDDPCDVLVCINDGVCNDCTCDCPEGFSGQFCENILEPETITITGITLVLLIPLTVDGIAYDPDAESGCVNGVRVVMPDGFSSILYSSDIIPLYCLSGEGAVLSQPEDLTREPLHAYRFEIFDIDGTDENLIGRDTVIIRNIGDPHDDILQIVLNESLAIINLDVSYTF